MIDENLITLGHKDLYHIAEWHEKQAHVLRARAHTLAQRKESHDHIARRLRFLDQIPRTVQTYLRQGHRLDDAHGFTARDSSVPLATVQNRWQKFVNSKSKRDKGERNQLILDLAALGLKNPDIGDRVGLHPVSVSRILGRERRQRLWVAERGTTPALTPERAPAGKKSGFPALSVV